MEEIDGTLALQPGPLIHVLSVTVQPKEPLAIHGKISVQFCDPCYEVMVDHDIYKRASTDAEFVGTSGSLTLTSPDYSFDPFEARIPLFRNRINVELFDGANNVFLQKCLTLEDKENEDDYEQVKSRIVSGERGTLVFNYITIPLGVNCRVGFRFYNRDEQKRSSINVYGKVVARYANTYGNYSSEECTLFYKQHSEFEPVDIGGPKFMCLSRHWVALPAYSSLVFDVDLSEFGTGRKLVYGTVELANRQEQGGLTSRSFVLDDMVIKLQASFFSVQPTPLGRYRTDSDIEQEDEVPPPTEEMDIEGKDEDEDEDEDDDDDGDDDDDLSSWSLQIHKPYPSPAVEIFSVFIGLDKSEALQIYGSMEISFDFHTVNIFKRYENDALVLSKHKKSTPIPILDGFRYFDYCESLLMKFQIKDVEDRLAIKGYVSWASLPLEHGFCKEKQLCSFIPGNHGFVAVHYSMFSSAVQANIKVSLKPTRGAAFVYPNIYGSLIAQYSRCDYSSRYNRDYYRIVLLKSVQNDSIPLNVDGTFPLSRSVVVVPSYSSLIIDVNLSVGITDQSESVFVEVVIGERRKFVEIHGCSLEFEVEWCEVESAVTSA